MRVLVVGGAGYVGSALVPLLLEKGHAVRVVDRLYYGDDGLKPYAGQIELVEADMRQIPRQALQDVEAVINLGGLSNDPTANYNPDANWQLNFHAVVKLATMCKARGIHRYIFAGSCSVYDRRERTEAEDLLLTEEFPLQPVGYYSEAKHAAEQALLSMIDSGFGPVILRKGTVFGYARRMRFDLVVNVMVRDALATGSLNLFGGGENWRPLLAVNDAARAYVTALEAPDELVRGEVFNIVHSNLRISELGLRVQSTLRSLGVPCEIRSDYTKPAARNYRVSGEKARRVLGFVAETSIEDAVREMVQQFRGFTAKQLYNPIHSNIEWMQMLERAGAILGNPEGIFADVPHGQSAD
jgi:nucleoside-diphosphate-sugar epimerase